MKRAKKTSRSELVEFWARQAKATDREREVFLGSPDEAMAALAKMFSAKVPNFTRFRYPIDGPNEYEKAFDKAMEEIFGPEPPDSPYSEWLRKLRRNGLISE